MLTILSAIFVFGVLVTVHEFGHFITAKLTGMRVDEFAIGFGPIIYQTKQGDTTYSLRAIPLGGFNKIAGMDPDEEKTADGFSSKPVPARMLVILAGSLMNFILPIILFFVIFASAGMDKPVNEAVLGSIMPNKPAAQAGLMPGDKIIAINEEAIVDWSGIMTTLKQYPNQEVKVKVDRAGSVRTYKMTPVYEESIERMVIGISPKFEKETLSLGNAAKLAVEHTKNVIVAMLNGLTRIVTGKAPAEVSGPIGVAQMAGAVAELGILPLLNFIAFLSINLGVINLLPIPALDGGHFVVLLVEALRGKPLGSRAMNAIQMVGVAIILAITVFSTFKDITR
ncbi:MAG: RIP metalloprotease RseP [Acidaminococcaceae bacterium]